MTSSLRLASLLTVLTVIAACGSGASSQPAQGQPIAGPSSQPVEGQPIAGPNAGQPMQSQPIAPPSGGGGGTPIAPPSGGGGGTATPVAAPAGDMATPTTRAYGALAAHNQFRARHCAPPLRWSARIAAEAQRYADTLAANGCGFRHSSSDYGENLMRFSPAGSHDAAYVVETWYREIENYDWNRPGFAMDTGHFTQVVWVGSTELGCGVALCNGGETWVCNYSEAGNMQGDFPDNVRPTSCQ